MAALSASPTPPLASQGQDLLDDPRVRCEVVALLYGNAGLGVVLNLLAVPLTWLAYRDYLAPLALLGALGAWCLLQALSAWNHRSWSRLDAAGRLDPQRSRALLARARRMALALSLGMAALVAVLHFADLPEAPALAAALALAYVLAASIATLIHMPQVLTFSVVVLGSQAVLLALDGKPAQWALAALLVLVVLGLWAYGRRYSAQLQQLILLRFQVQDLVAEGERQRHAAQAANTAKSRFFAAASHDVRQPLQAVMLTFHALKHAHTDERRELLIQSVESHLAGLRQLFDQVLDISRIDAGAVPVRPRPVALQPLFDRLDARFGAEAAAKHVWLRFAPTTAVLHSDPDALERMLANLVGNAIKYTQRGGVWVGMRRSRGRIEVRDSGVGLESAQHERIFEEFYQVDNPARDRASGLGLGLSIVQRLAGLLGQPVGLASAPGCGSTFWVSAPTTDALPEPAPPDSLSGALGQDGMPLQGLVVLLVENEAAIRTALAELLRDAGAQVRDFASAQALLDALAGAPGQAPPDVLVCDYRLDGAIDGVEVVQRLRAHWGQRIGAMILTGDTAVTDLARIDATLGTAAAQANTTLMHKPVTAHRLIDEVLALGRADR